MKKSKEQIKWEQEHDFVEEQLKIILNWSNYEDYEYVARCGDAETLCKLFHFVNHEIGVEFVSSVYELIEEEEEDNTTETLDKCKAFNESVGKRIFTV